ncbi:hypothetical protein POTOM_035196 [Populus tomentosa]|uniref:Helicase ATP-binding domain-containing protein n=1 Tax=Populus tomentosa TaxID=118781 RepID=A0A8X8CLW6_POPTO|nr:hypothetical protein POTOM_035196 [Populus tomentosa]
MVMLTSSAVCVLCSTVRFLFSAKGDEEIREDRIGRFNSLIDKTQFITTTATTISSFILSAISTPNSILAENTQLDDNFKDGTDALNHETTRPNDQLDISNLCLPQRLIQALHTRGITNLFTIQRAVLVPALEGRDIIARVNNLTGKALAFGIPVIKRLTEQTSSQTLIMPHIMPNGRLPRVLVLTPTRVLAKQVEKEMKRSAPYLNTLELGTPGRTIELLKGNSLKLEEVEYLVLDEADQMLSFGFEEDVEIIFGNLPSKRTRALASSEKGTLVSGKTIVFTQTKQDADGGKFPVLVATDIASHRLDIPNVDLVSVVPSEMLNQRSAIRSLERVAWCKFEFVNPPAIEEVLESSAGQMVATLDGAQPESSQFFAPSAQKLIEEQRRSALRTRLGHSSKKEPHAELSALGRHLSMSAQEAVTRGNRINKLRRGKFKIPLS